MSADKVTAAQRFQDFKGWRQQSDFHFRDRVCQLQRETVTAVEMLHHKLEQSSKERTGIKVSWRELHDGKV